MCSAAGVLLETALHLVITCLWPRMFKRGRHSGSFQCRDLGDRIMNMADSSLMTESGVEKNLMTLHVPADRLWDSNHYHRR